MNDPKIAKLIEKSLKSELMLTGIEALPLDIATDLNRVVFKFRSTSGSCDITGHDLLVLLDPNSEVVGHVPNSCLEQPNPHLAEAI